jgi:hypothetical protein
MTNRERTQIKKTTLISSSNDYEMVLDLGEKGISFGFAVTNYYNDVLLDDERFGTYILT